MKTIGLLGGMSWESTALYYKIINQEIKSRLGGNHSAKSLVYSVDFEEIVRLQHQDKWDELSDIMVNAAKKLKSGGADFLVLCTNTMHKLAEDIVTSVDIPLLHIAEVTANRILSAGIKDIALLGTKFTMEDGFFKDKFVDEFDINIITPDEIDRELIHQVIYKELIHGIITEPSLGSFQHIMTKLSETGAKGFILGCTEIGLLVHEKNSDFQLFDTTHIHATAAVEYALSP